MAEGSLVETVVFVVFAVVAIAGSLTTVMARNPVRSAMGLLAAMFAIAVFFVLNLAHFIAAVQVLIYAGAVVTLFLFVIMFIGVDKVEDLTENLPGQRQLALLLAVAFSAIVLTAGASAWTTAEVSRLRPSGSAEAISDQVFNRWVLPFELTAILVIIAAVGTIALAQFKPRSIFSPFPVRGEGNQEGGGASTVRSPASSEEAKGDAP